MSLKGFHIVFVCVSVILAVGFGIWCFRQRSETGLGIYGAAGIGSFFASAVLVYYGVAFLRKVKNLSFM